MDLMDSDLRGFSRVKQAVPAGKHVGDQITPSTPLLFGGTQRPYADELVPTVALSQPPATDFDGIQIVEAQIGRNPGGKFGIRGYDLA
jgi:hypothetical protein